MTLDPGLPSTTYEMIGRIVVAAAILEDRLPELAARVDEPGTLDELDVEAYRARVAIHAGKPGTAIAADIKARGIALVAELDQAEFRAYLDRLVTALKRRHDVVHNVWLPMDDTPESKLLGFRGLPARNRPDGQPHTSMTWAAPALAELLAELNYLAHWLTIWAGRVDTFGPRAPK